MNTNTQYPSASIGGIWSPLFVFLVAGFALRIALALYFPRIYHPDETFQILEQAYSFYAEGTVVPWEYRENIRSWLWPILVAVFAYPAEKLFETAFAFKLSAQILCSLASLCGIWAAWSIGRLKSEYHAWIGGFVAAFWFEFVYFSSHPLMDVISAHILMAAIVFLMRGNEGRNFIYAGFLLALAFVMRIQLAPALLIIAISFCQMDWRAKWLPLVLGGLFPVVLYGIIDWIMIGFPFSSIYKYFVINLIQDKASSYGISPYYSYVQYYIYNYGFFIFFVSVFLIYAMVDNKNRYLIPMCRAGLIVIIFHSLIPHKEYRFIYSATFLLLIVIALSSMTLFLNIFKTRKVLATGLLSLIWLGGSGALMVSKKGEDMLYFHRQNVDAFAWITQQQNICGIGILEIDWSGLPASVALHKPIPIYPDVSEGTDGKAGFIESYNLLLADDKIKSYSQKIPPNYLQIRCFSRSQQYGLCAYKREGTCTPNSAKNFNSYLMSRGQ
jgi:GPI mannosyltransferase 3